MWIADGGKDYELLDCGGGEKLERWGDQILVREQPEVENGEIAVVLVHGDEATVKTFKKQNGEIWLLPANPDYQPIDGRECEVLGKVVAVVRQY